MTGGRERTALYHIRGEGGELLYIGITNSVPHRWNGHMRVQPWWDELRSMTFDWFEKRTEAEAAGILKPAVHALGYDETVFDPETPEGRDDIWDAYVACVQWLSEHPSEMAA